MLKLLALSKGYSKHHRCCIAQAHWPRSEKSSSETSCDYIYTYTGWRILADSLKLQNTSKNKIIYWNWFPSKSPKSPCGIMRHQGELPKNWIPKPIFLEADHISISLNFTLPFPWLTKCREETLEKASFASWFVCKPVQHQDPFGISSCLSWCKESTKGYCCIQNILLVGCHLSVHCQANQLPTHLLS